MCWHVQDRVFVDLMGSPHLRACYILAIVGINFAAYLARIDTKASFSFA